MRIRPSEADDKESVLALYRRVARVPGGLARLESEVDEAFVESFLAPAREEGLSLLAISDSGRPCAEIHACSPGLACFAHVYSQLTIAVDPEVQGRGVGRQLFEAFMNEVRCERPAIERVELIARESNGKAIRFYESLGFEKEGELRGRIRNPGGRLESDIPMAWRRREK